MSKIEKIKNHLKEHKREYLIGGSCLVLGAVSGAAFLATTNMRPNSLDNTLPLSIGSSNAGAACSSNAGAGENSNSQGVTFIQPKAKTVTNNVAIIDARRQGPPSWVVRCVETGEITASQRAMSLAMDIPETKISKHLNGLLENAGGYHFERICVSA